MSGIATLDYLRPDEPGRGNGLWIAIGVSLLIHLVLFTVLSLFRPSAPPPPPVPMDVTIADDVGLTAGAPNTTVDPAESKAPVIDRPEDSAPPPAPSVERAEPAPPNPQSEAAPPPRPAAIARPQPKVAPSAPKAARAQAEPAAVAPAKPALKPGRGSGTTGTSLKRPTGLSFGNDYFKGATNKPSAAAGTAPKAAMMTAQAAMDIGNKIKQQVQPCANRQTNPGPGAERIRVTVRLRINRDGTLAGRPVIEGHDGIDASNERYQRQVDDRAIATFMGCQPLRGLPTDLYDVANGWSNFALRYKLPG